MAVDAFTIFRSYDLPERTTAVPARRPFGDGGWSLPWVLTEAARRRRTEPRQAEQPGAARRADERTPRPPLFGEAAGDGTIATSRRYAEDAEVTKPGGMLGRSAQAARPFPRPHARRPRPGGTAWRVRGRRARELGERVWLWLGSKQTGSPADTAACGQGMRDRVHRWEDSPRRDPVPPRRMNAPRQPAPGARPSVDESILRGIAVGLLVCLPIWLPLILWCI